MRISRETLKDAMTLDALIEELLSAKSGGHATGNEKVAMGSFFLHNTWSVKSVIVTTTSEGDPVIAVTSDSESAWVEQMRGERVNET